MQPMETLNHSETPDKDLPLRYDIRLLGRILGDTVRAQEGDRVFDLVEHIRRTGVQFHRNADEAARQELQAIMSGLPTGQALRIIRAFGYFSHLANIAEDQHHIRRTRAYAMAKARAAAGHDGLRARPRLKRRHIPRSNCRRSSPTLLQPGPDGASDRGPAQELIDREMEIARLLDERDRVAVHAGGAGGQPQGVAPRRDHFVADHPGARHRLRVIDEVANGLAYYDYTFLHALPVFSPTSRIDSAPSTRPGSDLDVPSFLRMGSWIGGDRDGNPFVTADVTRQRSPCKASGRCGFYLEEMHALGAELSLRRIVRCLRRA